MNTVRLDFQWQDKIYDMEVTFNTYKELLGDHENYDSELIDFETDDMTEEEKDLWLSHEEFCQCLLSEAIDNYNQNCEFYCDEHLYNCE